MEEQYIGIPLYYYLDGKGNKSSIVIETSDASIAINKQLIYSASSEAAGVMSSHDAVKLAALPVRLRLATNNNTLNKQTLSNNTDYGPTFVCINDSTISHVQLMGVIMSPTSPLTYAITNGENGRFVYKVVKSTGDVTLEKCYYDKSVVDIDNITSNFSSNDSISWNIIKLVTELKATVKTKDNSIITVPLYMDSLSCSHSSSNVSTSVKVFKSPKLEVDDKIFYIKTTCNQNKSVNGSNVHSTIIIESDN